MKIAIDLTSLYGRKRTGVEMYAIDLYKALLSTGHKIVPIFHVENEIDSNPDAVIIERTFRLLLENTRLTKFIKRVDADMVIFPIFPPPLDIYGGRAKIVPVIHDLTFKSSELRRILRQNIIIPQNLCFVETFRCNNNHIRNSEEGII